MQTPQQASGSASCLSKHFSLHSWRNLQHRCTCPRLMFVTDSSLARRPLPLQSPAPSCRCGIGCGIRCRIRNAQAYDAREDSLITKINAIELRLPKHRAGIRHAGRQPDHGGAADLWQRPARARVRQAADSRQRLRCLLPCGSLQCPGVLKRQHQSPLAAACSSAVRTERLVFVCAI